MASFPITAFRIEVAPNGGFIQGETAGGGSFDPGRVSFEIISAIAAVVTGPNPEYDPQHKVFICSARRARPLEQPLAMLNAPSDENASPAF